MPLWNIASRCIRSPTPVSIRRSLAHCSMSPARMRLSMYSRLRFSRITDSMPSRCRRCESINPAGPAPIIPTCVRMNFPWEALYQRPLLCQRRLEVVDEVVRILDPYREPHQGITDAQGRAHIGRHRAMRHERRVLDQAFHPAQAFRERKQPAPFEKAARVVERAVELRRDHAAKSAHLLHRERMLGMAR